jgi:hypothetical protein
MHRGKIMSAHFSKVLFATAASLLLAPPAFAHHPGAPGNTRATGPINTLQATTAEQGSFSIGLAYESTTFDALSDATLETEAEAAAAAGHAHAHSLDQLQSYAVAFAYGFSDDITLSLRAPYLLRDGVRTGHFHGGAPEVEAEGGSSGFGDVSALLQWRLARGENADVALFAGVTAPTGEDDARNDFGDAFATEFQPGSGAWDFAAGAAVTRRAGHWSFDASALYTFAGENDADDDLGDRLAYGAAASYRVLGHPPHHVHQGIGEHAHLQVDLALELNGEWHGEQSEGGETDPNSGGQVVYLAPGVRVVHEAMAGYLTIGVPVVSDMNGVQAEPDLRVTAGVSRRF